MNIESKILKLNPREESGSKTSRKYQFQKDLSLYLLLDEYEKKQDYLFLFDFHEDLVISNSSRNLHELEFYQIKSKDNKTNWTIKSLLKTQKDKNSILGKLYQNKFVFENNVKELSFISNANFNFGKLKDGSNSVKKSSINANELSSEHIEICEESIKREHGIDKSEFKDLVRFKVTELSNTDSSTHCIGALAKLINKINPDNYINAALAYKQVLNEVSIRTNATVGDKSFSNVFEIFELKGISKQQFLDFLKKAGLYKSVSDEWNEVKNSLESASINYIELLNYKRAWRDMRARLIKDAHSIPLRDLQNQIDTYILDNTEKLNKMHFLKIIDDVYQSIKTDQYDEYFIKCLIINKLNET